ncbi:DUF533 domain-containing protein [Primorskyibacter aestuariivivens]|uniref:DUF533 domain-containing protein n=1 Tax=Primorskyibacter aestuariivivens TaxID=1888912 RepID=UPI0023015D57|nr:DUF533 domain-containing protein [Primorskyibacter aestuariivivens]MDA7430598.1 DUF533 domain-containing protein [Primorskyibacter aestuariivivens]
MGLMGTLAKVAMGYAAARGVDHLSKNGGLGGLLGGAQVPSGEAAAPQSEAAKAMGQMPGLDQLQGMMGQMQEQGAVGMGNMQEMMSKVMGGAGGAGGMDLQSMLGGLMGGGQQQDGGEGGGLLSGAGGAGLAGLLAMAGGAAAASGQGVGGLLDQFKTADTAPEAEEAAGLMLRAMIQAAKADGDIDEAEKAKILETLGEDADAGDIAFVQAQLAAPVDVQALAAATPEAQKMQVYSMSLMSIRVDTEAEAAYLDQLAGALGLDQQTVNMLHMQMGVQPLYS